MTRKFRALLGAGAITATAALALAGCSSSTPAASDSEAPAADVIKVAALVPGNANDGGFNQVVADALQKLEDEGLIEFDLREDMADPATSEPVIADFASQGYDLIIGHGIELGDAIFSVAEQFPDVHFTASGGADILDKATDNVETWTYSTPEVGYLSGYVAGASQASPIGRVEAMDLPFITATDEYFQQGVLAANPAAELLPVVYAGSFDDAEAAGQATTGLIGQGAKLVYTTGDGIAAGVGSAATSAGIPTVGVSPAAGADALANNLTTVNLDMYPIFKQWVEKVAAAKFGGEGITSTFENGGLVYTPVTSPGDIDGAAIDAKVQELIAGLTDGSVTIN